MSRREQKKAEYKSQLVQATFQSIAETGLTRVNVQQISQRAGVSKGNIHYHFGGKDGLLLEVLKLLLEKIRAQAREQIPESNDPMERLLAYISAQFSEQVYTNINSKVWLNYWNEASSQKEFARLELINRKRLQSNLRFYLGQALDKKDVSTAAKDLHAMIDGLWMHKALSEDSLTSEQAIASVWRLVESYIQKK